MNTLTIPVPPSTMTSRTYASKRRKQREKGYEDRRLWTTRKATTREF